MRTFNVHHNLTKWVLACVAALFVAVAQPALAQEAGHALLPSNDSVSSAADAAFGMANLFDSGGAGISHDELLSALEGGADAGEPIALWRLGVMYENGDGVEQDFVKAFQYFSRIANDNASTPPHSIQADIVAQAFIKIGDYYRKGLPEAGIVEDLTRSRALILHAASYFGYAEAQYRVGMFHLDENELGVNPLQGARWLSLAAHKNHVAAQAVLGELLFNGEGMETQPVEGLMWLSIASLNAIGTQDEIWVLEMVNEAMSVASPEQRVAAVEAADSLGSQFSGF